ncbi:MAG: c-type cytochrome [Acetobacteraceae bacterium]
MSTRNGFRFALALSLGAFASAGAAAQSPTAPRFGMPATPAEIAGWNIDVTPDGAGLPPGSGTADAGVPLFAAQCATCHGAEGQGIPVPGRAGYPRLVGGIGTLATDHPVKTDGSFWPYATIIFDYIRRAMPLTHPQSLTADQVYALTAFILWKNGIIAEDRVMDAMSLPGVKMPNRDGFFTRPAPETANTAPLETPPFRAPPNVTP